MQNYQCHCAIDNSGHDQVLPTANPTITQTGGSSIDGNYA